MIRMRFEGQWDVARAPLRGMRCIHRVSGCRPWSQRCLELPADFVWHNSMGVSECVI